MNLKIKTRFYVTDHTNMFREINSIADLKTIIQNYDLELPRIVKLECCANVIKTDEKDSINNLVQSFESLIAPRGQTIATLSFIVANKIPCVTDIRKYLKKQYGETFDFRPDIGANKKPAILDFVHEDSCTGLTDSKTGRETHYTLHSVQWHYLTPEEMIVNNKMKQIWPQAKNTIPMAIQNFFKTTTK